MKPIPTHLLKLMSPADRKTLGKAGKLPEEIAAEQMAKSEGEIQDQICGYLRRSEIWFDQDAMHKRRTGTKSTPDFLLAYCGIPVGFEVKFPGKDATEDQKKCHKAMRLTGWRVFVVHSLMDVITILIHISKEKS